MAEPAEHNEDAERADGSRAQVSTRKLEAATGDPERQALIQSIRTIVRRLPQPYRANLICYLSKLGDVPAAALADCMQ